MTQESFTINDLAERWKCSRFVLNDLIRDGKLKCFRLGRAVRISRTEVERYERGEQ